MCCVMLHMMTYDCRSLQNELQSSFDELQRELQCCSFEGFATSLLNASPQSSFQAPKFPAGCLTSSFIDASLYAANTGYFNSNEDRIVSPSHTTLFDWSAIKSRTQYIQMLDHLYEKHADSWTTPVELYQPYFGYAVAHWIIHTYCRDTMRDMESLKHYDDDTVNESLPPLRPLNIIEIGGGNGTLCQNILEYIHVHYPSLYKHTHYTIIDYSITLHQQQQINCKQYLDDGRLTLINDSAINITNNSNNKINSNNAVNIILGIEVLDNMSHDKVITTRHTNEYKETHVWHITTPFYKIQQQHPDQQHQLSTVRTGFGNRDEQRLYYETYTPLRDRSITEYLTLMHDYDEKHYVKRNKQTTKLPDIDTRLGIKMTGIGQRIAQFAMHSTHDGSSEWIPTTALKFLKQLCSKIPNHHILLGDFNLLPNAIYGQNAPIVSQKMNGKTKDLDTYLCELGTADIFFPTNFYKLQHLYDTIRHNQQQGGERQHQQQQSNGSIVYSNYMFMKRHADQNDTITIPTMFGLSSFKPLFEDYINFQFLAS
jgi:hypothetical protein